MYRFKKSLRVLAFIASTLFAFTACSDFDNGYDENLLAYQRNFENLFGKIDPNQDWNMARQYKDNSGATKSTRANYNAGANPGTTPSQELAALSNVSFTVPKGWSVRLLGESYVSEEERKMADATWPEGNTSNFGSVNGYYISDGTPIQVRVIWSQTSAQDVIGVYDITNKDNRLPILSQSGQWGGEGTGVSKSYPSLQKTNVYEVTIPAGDAYGFYLEDLNNAYGVGHLHYSEASKNMANGNGCEEFKVVLAQDGHMMGFEDAHSGDIDYNDIVTYVTPPLTDRLVNVNSWILACEDLGNTDDLDFNDIVLLLEHDKANNTLTITPMAAGGVQASNIYFDNHDYGEIHSFFGSPVKASGEYDFYNTSSFGAPGTSIEPINVDAEFDVATAFDAGMFKIVTTAKGGNGTSESAILTSGTKSNYNSKGSSNAPAMMLLPGNWEWPKERTLISEAYPQFTSWVGDRTKTDWVTSKNPEKFVVRATSNEQTIMGGSDGSYFPTMDEPYTIIANQTGTGTGMNGNASIDLISTAFLEDALYAVVDITNANVDWSSNIEGTNYKYSQSNLWCTGNTQRYILSGDALAKAKSGDLKVTSLYCGAGCDITVKVTNMTTEPSAEPEPDDDEPGQGGGDSGNDEPGPNAQPRTNEAVDYSGSNISLDYNTYFKGLTTVTLTVTKGNESYQFDYGHSYTSLSDNQYGWYNESRVFTFPVTSLNGENLYLNSWGNWKDATLTISVE